ncbi:MAG TPA: nicotinate phosphoribosyltransferase, partial [Candidatus Nanoarchaeia archaeon]|nr:nicotinate phosphoribosyltransferase [Candidatus Nanoarchaeia archaeon]
MINELISKEDLALFTSAGRIKMGSIYFAEGMKDTLATFEATIRQDPKRNYFVFAGVHSIIEILKEAKFQEGHLNFLKQVYGFSEDYLDYLRNLK